MPSSNWQYQGHAEPVLTTSTIPALSGWQTEIPDNPTVAPLRLSAAILAGALFYVALMPPLPLPDVSVWQPSRVLKRFTRDGSVTALPTPYDPARAPFVSDYQPGRGAPRRSFDALSFVPPVTSTPGTVATIPDVSVWQPVRILRRPQFDSGSFVSLVVTSTYNPATFPTVSVWQPSRTIPRLQFAIGSYPFYRQGDGIMPARIKIVGGGRQTTAVGGGRPKRGGTP